MHSEDVPHPIFIDIGSKRFIDLLCDVWAAKTRVTLLHFNDGLDEFLRWAFGTGFFDYCQLMNTAVDTYAA
jgi:hypothetical protein